MPIPNSGGRTWWPVLFVVVWSADTGAYYTGKRWGRHKLAVLVSPGKTLEGLFGAFGFGLAAALLCALLLLRAGPGELLPFLLVCAATIAVSVIGDLTESLIKRSGGVKDSGELLPGHGGALDRIDSLTAAAPVFFRRSAVAGRARCDRRDHPRVDREYRPEHPGRDVRAQGYVRTGGAHGKHECQGACSNNVSPGGRSMR